MNTLLLIFLALPLLVFGRQHRSHENSESEEKVMVGDDAFSGQPQPVEPPRTHGRHAHSDYQRPPYNTPAGYGQYNNGPNYGGNDYPIPAAPVQPYPADNSPVYPVPPAQPSHTGPY